MATKKSEKKTANKKSATDRVVELTLENPKATREEIVETLKMDGFDKTAALLVEERQIPGPAPLAANHGLCRRIDAVDLKNVLRPVYFFSGSELRKEGRRRPESALFAENGPRGIETY